MSRRSGQSGSIQKDGNWYVVRYWKDVVGQEKRQRVRERICPISGPGRLSASERERRAKEIIAASKVDTEEYFNEVVRQVHGITFREQAAPWLDKMRNRKRKPVAPSTIATWAYALDKWINPNIGDLPLESVNNASLKTLVNKMDEGGLAPKSISNYAQVVKMVMKSVRDDKGQRVFSVEWDHEFIDMPVVNPQKQRCPSFTSEVVTDVIRETDEEKYRVLFALLASSGLRFGEALGLNIKNISPDCSTIKIVEKAWGSAVQDRLKTESGEREVDLHSSIAAMLRNFIGDRSCGLLFQSRNGKPLHQSSVLRRKLHPVLAALGQPKCGVHAFRRFRNTYLRNFTATPPGLLQFWMGHAGEGMSDLYDKIKADVKFRKEVAEKAGLGFELPENFSSKIRVIGPNGPKLD
jgi:integrase